MRALLEKKVAELLHKRLGFERLIKREVLEYVSVHADGRLFTGPIDRETIGTFRLMGATDTVFRYRLLLRESTMEFNVSRTNGEVQFTRAISFIASDMLSLANLQRHLEIASDQELIVAPPPPAPPQPPKTFWQKLFG